MTKFCSYFINQQKCLNKECLFLHIKPSQDDIFTHKDKGSNKLRIRNSPEYLYQYLLAQPAQDLVELQKLLNFKNKKTKEESDELTISDKSYSDSLPSSDFFLEELNNRFFKAYGKSMFQVVKNRKEKEKASFNKVKKNSNISQKSKLNSKKKNVNLKNTKSKKRKKKRVAIARWYHKI